MALQVYLESIGCKLNQCERDMLAGQFSVAGYDVVLDPEEADLCVVNTCAVTEAAGRKSRRRFRVLRRANPSARLVITGCYTGLPKVPDQREEELVVDLVVTNHQKRDLVPLVQAELGAWGLDEGVCELSQAALAGNPDDLGSARVLRPRTRPLVKIQDGCDNSCSYCIVRSLRGRQRSRPRQEILQEIAGLVRQGYHEVVLTGVHVGAYGKDIEDSLGELVRAILRHSPPERLRLSSIEPWDLARALHARARHADGGHANDFFALWEDSRLCRHLHLPLQSGCDTTLRRMNRNYTTAQYAGWMAQARAAIPGLALTTDVIAGFPGETESEFFASMAFIEQMQFARVHTFSYSPRPGTPAAEMPDQVDLEVRQQRALQIREIGQRSGESFRRQFLGCTLPVLWEIGHSVNRRIQDIRRIHATTNSVKSCNCWSGLTDNYIRVYAESERDLANVLCPARLCALETDGIRGEVLEPA
jgi:threonylcarbamoyladenosine tRNA methylthiotransferase MtaB